MEKIIFKNYKVTDTGEVYSLYRNRRMKTSINHKGYEQIYIMVDGKKLTTTVHRLVAIAFVPNPNNLPQVNHKDGKKLRNYADNLEWCDDSYNQNHAFKHGLKLRKKIRMYDFELETEKEFDSIKSCANFLETTQYNISRIVSGIRKNFFRGRYGFEYVD